MIGGCQVTSPYDRCKVRLNHPEQGVSWSFTWQIPVCLEWAQAGPEGLTVVHGLICICNVAIRLKTAGTDDCG